MNTILRFLSSFAQKAGASEMTVIKKKVTRKEKLKQPDAFIGAANEAAEWYNSHKKQVFLTIALAAAAVLGIWGSMMLIEHSKAVASASFYEVQRVLDADINGEETKALALASEDAEKVKKLNYGDEDAKTKALLRALDETIASQGGNGVGQMARLRKAIALYNNYKPQEAVQVLKDYLSKSNKNDSFHFRAVELLGYSYESAGDLDSALKQFASLSEAADKSMAEAANYHQGRIYLQKNDAEKAKEFFKKVIDEAAGKEGTSAFASLAETQLASI